MAGVKFHQRRQNRIVSFHVPEGFRRMYLKQPELIKPSALLTHWLKTKNHHSHLRLAKPVCCKTRTANPCVRCQQQDLFTSGVQTIFKEGFDVIQMELCWQNRIRFVLADDFSLRNHSLAEEDINEMKETTKANKNDSMQNLILMSESCAGSTKTYWKPSESGYLKGKSTHRRGSLN